MKYQIQAYVDMTIHEVRQHRIVHMDGVHLTDSGNRWAAQSLCDRLMGAKPRSGEGSGRTKTTRWTEKRWNWCGVERRSMKKSEYRIQRGDVDKKKIGRRVMVNRSSLFVHIYFSTFQSIVFFPFIYLPMPCVPRRSLETFYVSSFFCRRIFL
jgi:hypothetical protein